VINRENFQSEVSKLPGMGDKIASKVEEWLYTGKIPEVESILASGRYRALSTFNSIYGIGPGKARQFYDMGMRTLSDLERYFGVTPGSALTTPAEVDEELRSIDAKENTTPNGKRIGRKDKVPDITIPVGLALRGELGQKIPRDEVEEMRNIVMAELDELQPGCVHTIVGG